MTATRPETLVPFNRHKTADQILIDLVPNSAYYGYHNITGGIGSSAASGGSFVSNNTGTGAGGATAPLLPPASDQVPLYQMPTGPNPMITGTGTMVPLDLLKNRLPARVVAVMDAVSYNSFHRLLHMFYSLTYFLHFSACLDNKPTWFIVDSTGLYTYVRNGSHAFSPVVRKSSPSA